jgi:CheY-like chemotaxis protein
METGGTSKIDYLRDGIVCTIFLPNASLSKTAPAAPVQIFALPKIPNVVMPDPLSEDFRILIVEDSFLVVTSIEGFFNELGWKIVGPASRKDAGLALAQTETFDAALLDVNLDGEMSWDIAAVLQERGIPFVFSTGYDGANILPDFLAGSVVLGKPFREDELARKLRECVRAVRAKQVFA